MKKLMVVICLFITTACFAQQKTVKGVVTGKSDGTPLSGVTVTGQNKNTTTTDSSGQFVINATPGESLIFSFVGKKTLTVTIPASGTLAVELADDVTDLNQIVVTGYQTQRKSDLTGSVAIVNMNSAKDISSGSTLQNIQGRVPGLYITSDGSPSGAARSTIIRGMNTLGNTNPLYIIDGVPTTDPNTFQFMDPNTVESVQVLKDASAASIYGSRASNGVIIVTTRQGKNKVSITVNQSFTTAKYARRTPMMNTEEFGATLWRASVNGGTPATAHSALYSFEEHTDANGVRVLDKVTPVPFINGDQNIPSANTDWQKEVFRNAFINQTNVTLTAGGANSSSLISFGYYTNSGMVVNNDYKRFTARINNSFSLFNNKVKIGENFQLLKAREHPMGNDQGGTADWNADGTARAGGLGGATPLALSTTILPILPVRKLDGSFAGPIGAGFSDRMNPVFLADLTRDDMNNDLQAFGNVYLEITPVKNLVFRSSLGMDYTENNDRKIQRKFQHGFIARSINDMSVAHRFRFNWTWSNTVNYTYSIHQSRFNVLAGMEAIKNTTQVEQSVKRGFSLEDEPYFQLSAGTGVATNKGFYTGNQLLSYFGKLNYSFADKYLLSGTLRYDGSSRFGINKQFGLFPALSVGWVISRENFMSDASSVVSNLKLRAGTGKVGNQEIGDYSRFQQYLTNYGTVAANNRATGSAYDMDGINTGNLPSGYVAVRTMNPDLRWESTTEINTGVDFGFWDQRITGSFDYFSRETKDILVTPPTPGVLGEGAIKTVNGASMSNKGFELILGYHGDIKDFSYTIEANASRFRDKITYLPASVVRSYAGNVEKTILDHSRTSYFGYVTDGIFQNQEEVDQAATQPGKGVGRIRYKDLNKDGVINALDQDWLGTELPGLTYGVNIQMNYKNFGLVIFMRGVSAVTVNDASKSFTDFLGTNIGTNKGKRLLNAWTPQNTQATVPAASLVNANSETRASDYFLVQGDYFKVQTIQLNYTVPSAFASRLKLSSLRLFGIADNALLFFKKNGAKAFTGPDPETPGSVFPRPVRFVFGLDVRF